nr:DKNYY domain-containing protein [uncultured Leptotrichia sp.]
MNLKKLLKIFGLLILAGNIVNAEYIKRNGEIYYRDWSEEKTRILKNIDKKSFEILENDFAKDKNNIYYQGKKLNNVNPNYFKIVDNEIKYNNEFYKIDENMNLIKIERE